MPGTQNLVSGVSPGSRGANPKCSQERLFDEVQVCKVHLHLQLRLLKITTDVWDGFMDKGSCHQA